jgi:hypothetical protein
MVTAIALAASTASVADVSFATKPTVTKDGDTVRIRFAASTQIDAEVAVVNKDGRVVRHLAAGLLGPNVPAPFAKDSLSQDLAWDGKDDYGEPTPAGQYDVSVRLGLHAQFGRIVEYEKPSLLPRGVTGFAVDEKGNVFALQGWTRGGVRLGHPEIIAWDSAGAYRRTLLPVGRDVPADRTPGQPRPSDVRCGMLASTAE